MGLVARLKLAELLEKKGITQRELARRTGIRQPSIVEMCNGQCVRLPLKNLAKICEVLGVGVEDVIELVESEDSHIREAGKERGGSE
jgi:putative transcriptional regulator